MAKADVSKVNYAVAQIAVSNAKSRNTVYSECIRLSFRTSGRLACGFDNKDLQAWIDKYMPDVFDKKGNKI
jgi:hypothetical protein